MIILEGIFVETLLAHSWIALTDTGIRRKNNEDYFKCPDFQQNKKNKKGALFIVCDGLGGAKAGEVASKFAANFVFDSFYNEDSFKNSVIKDLTKYVKDANQKILKLSNQEKYQGLGTTAVIAHFFKNKLSILSIGDSRIYQLYDKKLMQLSEDHSFVWDLFREGLISKEEMRIHPRSNIVTSALGVDEEIKIFSSEILFDENSLFLLCSDGLTDMIPENEIEDILNQNGDISKKGKDLVDLANLKGGKDNITIILIKPEKNNSISCLNEN